MSRRTGWWGIVFVVGLFVVGAMVSLPTAADTGERIKAFYHAHQHLIILQQVASVLILAPFLAFAFALDRRDRRSGQRGTRWIMLTALLLVAAEFATNLPPLVLALMPDLSPGTAHMLTLVGDMADAALFVSIALFSFVAVRTQPTWVRLVGLLVTILAFIRAITSPLGGTILDAAAPIAFLAFVLVLSVRMLLTPPGRRVGYGRTP